MSETVRYISHCFRIANDVSQVSDTRENVSSVTRLQPKLAVLRKMVVTVLSDIREATSRPIENIVIWRLEGCEDEAKVWPQSARRNSEICIDIRKNERCPVSRSAEV